VRCLPVGFGLGQRCLVLLSCRFILLPLLLAQLLVFFWREQLALGAANKL
jgi:hypothetical protein